MLWLIRTASPSSTRKVRAADMHTKNVQITTSPWPRYHSNTTHQHTNHPRCLLTPTTRDEVIAFILNHPYISASTASTDTGDGSMQSPGQGLSNDTASTTHRRHIGAADSVSLDLGYSLLALIRVYVTTRSMSGLVRVSGLLTLFNSPRTYLCF